MHPKNNNHNALELTIPLRLDLIKELILGAICIILTFLWRYKPSSSWFCFQIDAKSKLLQDVYIFKRRIIPIIEIFFKSTTKWGIDYRFLASAIQIRMIHWGITLYFVKTHEYRWINKRTRFLFMQLFYILIAKFISCLCLRGRELQLFTTFLYWWQQLQWNLLL